MTCREKLKIEHPEKISDVHLGGCFDCPHTYGYLKKEQCICHNKRIRAAADDVCTRCWDQEITCAEPRISNMSDLLLFVEKVMANGDKSVNIYIKPDGDLSISVYPYKEEQTNE